jgi:hypothetical protein
MSGVIGSKLQVKYDPFDLGHAYAYVGNTWIECMSQHYAQFKDLTEKEYQAISFELAEEHKQSSKRISASSQQVAAFITRTKGTEKELIAQKQAEEQSGKFGFEGNFEKPVQPEPAMPDDNTNYNNDDDTEPDDEYQILS